MKLSNKKLLALLVAAAGCIWRLTVPAVAGVLPCSGAMLCGLAAAVVAILYLMLFRTPSARQAEEAGALSICLTFGYVAAAMALNAWLILRYLGGFNPILLLGNAVLAVGYLALVIGAERSAQRLSAQLERTEEKLSVTAELSAKLGAMLALAEDQGVRERILKLKEAVDYSSNITTGSTFEREKQMEGLLDELLALLSQGGEASLIQDKLREAEHIWRARSAAAASAR